MHRTACTAALILLIFAAMAAGRERVRLGAVRGTVVDLATRTAVAGATVSVVGQPRADTTDGDGGFSLDSVSVGVVDIEVSAQGYDPLVYPALQVKVGANRPLVLQMRRSTVAELDKLVVTSSRLTQKSPEQSTSVIKVTRDQVNNAPGALQDVNRVILTMPSAVSSNDDSQTYLFVRGGNQHENVFLLDGIEVNNISHWGEEYESGGQISSLHPDFIRDLDFYAGGFPARLPPRLSSVVDIHFREGSMTARTWQIDASIAGFGAFLEGPFIRDRASYMLNARISVLDLLEPLLDEGGLPQYQNGQLKLVFDVTDQDKLTANALVGHETIEASSDADWSFREDAMRVVGGLQWQHSSERVLNRLLVSGLYHRWDDWNEVQDTIVTWRYFTERTQVQLKNDLHVFLRDRDVLSLGAVVECDDRQEGANWDDYYLISDGSRYIQQTSPPDSTDTTLTLLIEDPAVRQRTDTLGWRVAGHAGYTAQFGCWKLYGGVRDDYYSLLQKHGVSPRVSALYDMGRPGTISLSGGLHYQYPSYVQLLEMQDKLQDVELQRNVQATLAYEKQFSDVIVGGAEAYVKYYDREPSYVIESDPWMEGYRTIDTTFSEHGRKYVYGLELYLQKKRLDRLYYSVSYTFFNAQTEYADGSWYEDDQNIRNNLNLVVGSKINRHHQIALRLDLSEGYPYTPIDRAASEASMHTVYDVSDGWNSRRREARAKVGVRYDLTLFFKRTSLTLYAEVTNLLNQQDIVWEWYEYGDEPPGRIARYYSRGILPIGGLKIEF